MACSDQESFNKHAFSATKLISGLLLVLLLILVSGCGGGSSSSSSSSLEAAEESSQETSESSEDADVPPQNDTPPASAEILLNTNISSDGVIDAVEIIAGNPIAISGTTGGDITDGDMVTLTVNNNSFSGLVANNAFSIDVPVAELVDDSDSTIEASITTTTGNPNGEATATANVSYTVMPDTTAPTAVINFPPVFSTTTSSSVTVRGSAEDLGGSGLAMVRLNGQEVVTVDNFSTWSIELPLELGVNALTVEVTDIAQNTNMSAATVQIEYNEIDIIGQHSVLDAANNRVLSLDGGGALIAIDIESGVRSILVNGIDENGDNQFGDIRDIALDRSKNQLFLASASSIKKIDLVAGPGFGEVSELSDFNDGASPRSFLSGITVDSANNRVFVFDSGRSNLVSVDLTTGNEFGDQTIVSSNTVSNSGVAFGRPTQLIMDEAAKRILLLDVDRQAVMAVNLDESQNFGFRSIVSDANTPNVDNAFESINDFVLDSANNQVLVTDNRSSGAAVLAVDLNDGPGLGQRSLISDDSVHDVTTHFGAVSNILFNEITRRAFILGEGFSEFFPETLFSLDLQPDQDFGSRKRISSLFTPDANIPLANSNSIVLDKANSRALVIDRSLGALVSVDLTDSANFGVRSIVAEGNELSGFPVDVALDTVQNRVLIIDLTAAILLSIDLNEGANFGTISTVSDNATPGLGREFVRPISIVFDELNNRALVLDSGFMEEAVISVDLDPGPTFGVRTVVSDESTPNSDIDLGSPKAIALDSRNNRVIVLSEELNGSKQSKHFLSQVDLTPGPSLGARTVISNIGLPNGENPLVSSKDLALDEENNRVLVVNSGFLSPAQVIAVDLDSGQRTVVSAQPETSPFVRADLVQFDLFSIDLDNESDIALVIDNALDAVVAVDLIEGQRVIISR